MSAERARDPRSGLVILADNRRPERRRRVREIARYVESDLFKRVPEGHPQGVTFKSPLGWVVEYGYDEEAEGHQAVWIEIRNPDGTVLKRTEDGDVTFVEDWLP